MQNDCSEALGKGTRHMLVWGRMSAGKEKGKQQKSDAATMEQQQRTGTVLACSILSEQSGSERIFFFLLAQSLTQKNP